MPDGPVELYQFGDFQLNVGERTLERREGRERIVIPEKAFQALVHLVRSSGALVRKDSILATVWPGVLVEEGNIGKVMHAIRRALGDGTGAWTYIATVPKHGYRFIADVRTRPIIDHYLATHPNDEGGSLTGVKALLLAKSGKARDAGRTIARAIELGTGFGHFHHTAYNIAATYAVLREPDEAVNWVEAAADEGFPCYPCFARDPSLVVLRGLPRFDDLMSQLRKQWGRFRRMSGS